MTNIRTVDASFAVDTSEGQTYILNMNQSLDFTSTMTHSLMCTNQARINNVIVDDVPKSIDQRNTSTHSVFFPENNIRLPLQMHGPISYLPVRYPSNEEMEFCPMLDLTSQDEWDPTCIETLENGIIGISSFNLKFEDKIYNEMMFSDASNRLG